ncbi:MAG: hypothetical protein COW65_10990 [Cytophagales bacterium CG18_big_fil_WC_8_21_14_2_50_42_9]|nr:MAG: hypothetical protein COW65_10990 [Cytophagales bacterium CG18_big_fil_WC_8_21_14_2_50_42_9]
MKYSLFLLFIVVVLFGCEEKISLADDDLGQAYLPVKVGQYQIYDVSETKVYDNQYDSVTYQVKELIDSVYTNQANELTYRILKSRRSDAAQPWGSDSLYTININKQNVQETRNNKRTIKLIFPVDKGKEWNVNAFNAAEEKEYFYEDVNQPLTINGRNYDKTMKVIQGQPNEIELDDRFEVYAYNTGIIYKKIQFYAYAQKNGEVDLTKVANGTKRIFTLKEFYSPE